MIIIGPEMIVLETPDSLVDQKNVIELQNENYVINY